MSEVLQTFLRLFQRNQKERKITIGGLDYAGKTTLLYKLKLGEVVQTIPTIGFNVETVQCPSKLTGTKLTLTCWDVGGCSQVSSLHRYYAKDSAAIVWVVDSSDRDRVLESAEELKEMCTDKSTAVKENKGVGPHVPILILANKQDLPNAMKSNEVVPFFESVTKGRLSHVMPTSNIAPLPESGLADAFDWLKTAIDVVYSGSTLRALTPLPSSSESPAAGSKVDLHSRFESYLSRATSDSLREVFPQQFEGYNLPSWDHYTHIRLAYTILTEYGRQKGKDMIFDGIKSYIANSKQTTGRAFHITMTYFWFQIVHFGMRSVPPAPEDVSLKASEAETRNVDSRDSSIITDDTTTETMVSEKDLSKTVNEDFCRFLVLNPYVVDGNLWADYYSKDVMMSPTAKGSMVFPDKKPLPNLVARDAIKRKH